MFVLLPCDQPSISLTTARRPTGAPSTTLMQCLGGWSSPYLLAHVTARVGPNSTAVSYSLYGGGVQRRPNSAGIVVMHTSCEEVRPRCPPCRPGVSRSPCSSPSRRQHCPRPTTSQWKVARKTFGRIAARVPPGGSQPFVGVWRKGPDHEGTY